MGRQRWDVGTSEDVIPQRFFFALCSEWITLLDLTFKQIIAHIGKTLKLFFLAFCTI